MTKKSKRKRHQSSPAVQQPNKQQRIKDYLTQQSPKMEKSKEVLDMDTLAACAEVERDLQALKGKSIDEKLYEIAKDIKEIKLQQALDKNDLDKLKNEVRTLHFENEQKDKKIKHLEAEINYMKEYSMRNNLLFKNIESGGESENIVLKVKTVMKQMGVANVDNIRIERAHRLGIRGSNTPIVVKFAFYGDRMSVWEKRRELKQTKYFISEHYPQNVEIKRREFYPLLPFLKKQYGAQKVYLRKDTLVCDKKEYTVDSIQTLLDGLKGDPGSLSNDTTHVFLGKYSPLSNFFPCEIEINGNKYCSAEQAYQHAKACFTGNKGVAEKIKAEVDPIKIKREGDFVNSDEWISSGSAEKAMKAILTAKFSQSNLAKKSLKETGKKRLGEANQNRNALYWATGFSKGSKYALNSEQWTGRNTLGKIMEEIRDKIDSLG